MYNPVSSQRAAEIMRELTNAANGGRLTRAQMVSALQLHVDDQEYIPESVGLRWIMANTTLFGERYQAPATILLEQIEADVAHIGELVVMHKPLLSLFTKDELRALLRAALTRSTPRNSGWVTIALELGVPRQFVADLILQKLRDATVHLGSSVVNFMKSDFLGYGAGRNRQVEALACLDLGPIDYYADRAYDLQGELWSVLTDAELTEAMQIVVEKAPNWLFIGTDINGRFGPWHKLRRRLPAETVSSLMEQAAARLESLEDMTVEVFSQLPGTARASVIRRLQGGSFYVLLTTALSLGGEKGRKLFDEFYPQFKDKSPAHHYTWSLPYLDKAEDKILAALLERQLTEQLAAQGYVLGVISEGTYYNARAGQRLKQLQVVDGRKTYVEAKGTMNKQYYPRVGDMVLFRPDSGRQLNPRVTAVVFSPVRTGTRN